MLGSRCSFLFVISEDDEYYIALLTICGSCRVSIRKARDVVSVVKRRQQPWRTSRPHSADPSRRQTDITKEEVFGCHGRDDLGGVQSNTPISGPADFHGVKSVGPGIRILRHSQIALRLQMEVFELAGGAIRARHAL